MSNRFKISGLAFSALLVLALLVTAWPVPAQAGPVVANKKTATAAAGGLCASTYIVQEGDALTNIAHTYHVKWRDLAKINKIRAPYTVTAGTELCIPGTISGTPVASAGTVRIYASAGRLFIATSGYTTDAGYLIKAGANTSTLEAMGKITVTRKISQTQAFTIPANLRKITPITVCLKNLITDALTCSTVVNK